MPLPTFLFFFVGLTYSFVQNLWVIDTDTQEVLSMVDTGDSPVHLYVIPSREEIWTHPDTSEDREDGGRRNETSYDILRILSFPRTQSIGSDNSLCDVCRLLEAYFVRSRKNVLQADLYPIIQIRSVFCRLE